MKKNKCEDCTSDLFQISPKKLMGIVAVAVPAIITSTFKVSGLIHEQQQYNSDTDSLKVTVSRIEDKIDILHMNMFNGGLINSPNDLAYKSGGMEIDTFKVLCEVIKKEDEKKRFAVKETAFDIKDIEQKILE